MIAIVVAMTRGRVIGHGGAIPWKDGGERKLFMRLTKGKTVIMGRKTFESIGKALPGRRNIVMSRTAEIEGVEVCRSIEDAFKAVGGGNDAFVIGGAEVYRQAIGRSDKMYVSYMKSSFEGSVLFPDFDEKEWVVERNDDFPGFQHVVYSRRGATP
ncbi:MAG: dihydrofolate reductase [Candidatus Micrarchaeota archaeon]|nr:dihydrofolate reductase [Candidatus Micrarchaeota archaeon]MDE1823989.1 dihydrofolate reductase [Candidatus Micrarchaeota archaeon]MDE1849987.1 dihydrofolate reductase [Candidatus Micrarchaeota archaeon]